MRKMRTGVVLAAVIGIAVVTRATPAGDSAGTRRRGWWTEGRQPVTQQKAAAKPNPAAAGAAPGS